MSTIANTLAAPAANVAKGKQGGVKPFAMYCISLLISGATGIVVSGIALPSAEIVFFRAAIAAIILLALFIVTRKKLTVLDNKKELALLSASGVAMGLEWLFLYEAYQTIGIGLSTVLCYCAPIIVMLLAPVLFKERLTALKVIGLGVVVAGCVLVNVYAISGGVSIVGMICGLASAILFALMLVLNKKVTQTQGIERPLVQLLAGGAVVAIYVAARIGFPVHLATSEVPSVVIVGVMSAVYYFLYFDAMGKLSVSSVAVCGYLEPLSALVMSVAFLGEHMLLLQIVGAGLIIGGAIFGEVFGNKKPAKAAAL